MGGDSAVREIEMQEKMRPTSNVRNNWVSAELSGGFDLMSGVGLSAGARYERMLGPYVSLGANFYWFIPLDKTYSFGGDHSEENGRQLEAISPDIDSVFGIDASFRVYPWGRKFFLGLALGYHATKATIYESTYNYDIVDIVNGGYTYKIGDKEIHYSARNQRQGLAITGEFGWKIDVGKEGGFFVQPGFLGTFIVGTQTFEYSDETYKILAHHRDGDYFNGYWRFYLGADWAF